MNRKKSLILRDVVANSIKRHENMKAAIAFGIVDFKSYQEHISPVVEKDIETINHLTENIMPEISNKIIFTPIQLQWIANFSTDMYIKGISTFIEDIQRMSNNSLIGSSQNKMNISQDIFNILKNIKDIHEIPSLIPDKSVSQDTLNLEGEVT